MVERRMFTMLGKDGVGKGRKGWMVGDCFGRVLQKRKRERLTIAAAYIPRQS